MKIGIAFDDSLDRPDGVQQHILTLGEWLENHGHKVYYLVGNSKPIVGKNIHSLARVINVKFNKNRLSIPLPVSKNKLRKLLNSLNLDLLHIQMPFSPFFVGRLINIYHGPTVATFHILPSGKLSIVGNKLLAKVQKNTIKKIDDIIAVSSPAGDYAAKTYKTIQPKIIPNSIFLDNLSKYSKKTKRRFIEIRFLGRLVPRKGAMVLVKAVDLLHKNNPDLKINLSVCGSGPMLKKISKYLKTNNLEKIIKMKGQIKESEKPEFLNDADIAVFPASGGESFGIVLIEAINFGSGVVIGGDNPGYRYVLNDEKTLFSANSELELSKLLLLLINNPKLRQEINSKQNILIEKFNIDINGPKIIDVYNSIVAL